MPALRRKQLIPSRRRVDDEGEDEEAGDFLQDDVSQSEGSISELDSNVDDLSRVDSHSPTVSRAEPLLHDVSASLVKGSDAGGHASNMASMKDQSLRANGQLGNIDNALMTNSMASLGHAEEVKEIDFADTQLDSKESLNVQTSALDHTARTNNGQGTPVDRRRQEHEEYRKKKEADPTFIPNRGAFFMHDHRHAGPAANGFRPFNTRGRGGRGGRGSFGGSFGPMHSSSQTDPINEQWTHNMHETVREPDNRVSYQSRPGPNQLGFRGGLPVAADGPSIDRILSTTPRVKGVAPIRLLLVGMTAAVDLPSLEIKQYAFLPDQRPPMRKDKPVRIYLPHNSRHSRHIYPATDRSFIYIERRLRHDQPQPGFTSRTARGRSGPHSSVGAYSRRTSMYGGSVYGASYTPSMGMSRRSSLAYDTQRNIVSPSDSTTVNGLNVSMDGTRPVVRLPPVLQVTASVNGKDDTISKVPVSEGDQPPSGGATVTELVYRENRQNSIPMHQPRPQKSVSLADIESPASMPFVPPQQDQQPFHQQVPARISGLTYAYDTQVYPQSSNTPFTAQIANGTPLAGIPERAIHAQPFQSAYQQQPGYYLHHPMPMMQPQHSYYYPPPYNQNMSVQAPVFQPAQPPVAQPEPTIAGQNLVAQELNGMVYYYNAADIPSVSQAAASYTFPPSQFPQFGVGAMMTPSPDGFYVPHPPQGVVYYQ